MIVAPVINMLESLGKKTPREKRFHLAQLRAVQKGRAVEKKQATFSPRDIVTHRAAESRARARLLFFTPTTVARARTDSRLYKERFCCRFLQTLRTLTGLEIFFFFFSFFHYSFN